MGKRGRPDLRRGPDPQPLPFEVSFLATEEDTRAYLHGRIRSREWWVIPAVSENAVRVAEIVERRHFPGRTGGFEELILNAHVMGVCGVVLAAKRRLPAARLNALLRELGGPPGIEAVGGQDILAVLDCGDGRTRSLARTLAFADWLQGARV